MRRYLLVMILTGIAMLSSCGSAEAPTDSARTAPTDLLSALSTGDHRVLDEFDPTDGAVEELRRQRADGPYILGRALEQRGRDAAAQLVYRTELTAGATRWAGLSAVRLAALSVRRDNLTAAQGHADVAVDLVPEFRDGWMALGTTVYRRDDYSALREVVERIPPEPELFAAERVSAQDLSAEVALWRAVAAWEVGEDREAAFQAAFIREPVHAIHERLFLFLFYRSDGLSSVSPELRLLMEAVYRQHRGEPEEAMRLMAMIEPDALIELTTTVLNRENRRQPEPRVAEAGIWNTIIAIAEAHSDDAGAAWVNRLFRHARDRAEDDQFQDLAATVALIQAEGAIRRRLNDREVTQRLFSAGSLADSDEMRARIAARLVTFSVSRERPLGVVMSDLTELASLTGGVSTPEAYATAVDRLLPRLVQDRAWREIAALLPRIPDDARIARTRMLLILLHAEDAGLISAGEDERRPWEEELAAAAEELSAVGYSGMLGRLRAGLPIVLTDQPAAATEGRDLDSAHVEALLLAGESQQSLPVAMRIARSADRAEEMLEIATLMAELGHTSDALDVARRAVSRAELPLTPSIISLIYPIPYRAELQDAADRYGVPVHLLTALVREESHFRPIALSPVGAQGLGQIMPATAEEIRWRMAWPEADVRRPADNLLMSAYYLNYLAGEIESPVLRLAAYNAGLGRGRRWERSFGDLPPILQIEALPFVETRRYLQRITVSHALYSGQFFGTEPEAAVSDFMEGAIW